MTRPRSGPSNGMAVADGLAGVGMWALGYDAGQPGYWEAIASTFGVLRLAGVDRYGTAVAVSANLLQPGVGTMIVANGEGLRRRPRWDRGGRAPGRLAPADHADGPAGECRDGAGTGGPGQDHRARRHSRGLGCGPGGYPGQGAVRRGDPHRRRGSVRHRRRPLAGGLSGWGEHGLHRLGRRLPRRPGRRCAGGQAGRPATPERPAEAVAGDAGGAEATGADHGVPAGRHGPPCPTRWPPPSVLPSRPPR